MVYPTSESKRYNCLAGLHSFSDLSQLPSVELLTETGWNIQSFSTRGSTPPGRPKCGTASVTSL